MLYLYRIGFYQKIYFYKLRRFLSVKKDEIDKFFKETAAIELSVRNSWYSVRKEWFHTGMLDFCSARIIYAIVRTVKPEVVIETGVGNGASSYFILSALELNGKGYLYSIDYPASGQESFIPEGKDPGWMVPERLRSNWTLELGKTFDKLKPLLDRIKKIDIFFHDSEHTYETMLFEFETVWPYMSLGGLLISDDVGFNMAFRKFVNDKRASYLIQANKLGVVKNG